MGGGGESHGNCAGVMRGIPPRLVRRRADQKDCHGHRRQEKISLPADLARDTEALARAEGKTLSAVIQDALRQARVARRQQELGGIQGYWSRKARDKSILTEQDLERYLGR